MNTYVRIEVRRIPLLDPRSQSAACARRRPIDCGPLKIPTEEKCPTYGWPVKDRLEAPRLEELTDLRLSGALEALLVTDDAERSPTITECCVTALFEAPDTGMPVAGLVFPVQVHHDWLCQC